MSARRVLASSLLLLASGEVLDSQTGRVVLDNEDTVVLDDEGSQARDVDSTAVFGLNSTGKVHTAGASKYSQLELAADEHVQSAKEALKVRAASFYGSHTKEAQQLARTASRMESAFFFKPTKGHSNGEASEEDTPEGEDIPESVGGKKKKGEDEVTSRDRSGADKGKNKAEVEAVTKAEAQAEAESQDETDVPSTTGKAKAEVAASEDTLEVQGPALKTAEAQRAIAGTKSTETDGTDSEAESSKGPNRDSQITLLRGHADTLKELANKLLGYAKVKETKAVNQQQVRVRANKLALQQRESLAPVLNRFLTNGLLKKTTQEYMPECRYVGDEGEHEETSALCAEAEEMRTKLNSLVQKMLANEQAYVQALENAQAYVVDASQEVVKLPSIPDCFDECKAAEDARQAEAEKLEALQKLDELEEDANDLWQKVQRIPSKKNQDGTSDRRMEEWKGVMRYMLEEFIGRRALSAKVNAAKDIELAHKDLKEKFERMKEFVMTFTPQSLGAGGVHYKMKKWMKEITAKVETRKEKYPQIWNRLMRLNVKVQQVLPDGEFPDIPQVISFLNELQTLLAECKKVDRSLLGDAEIASHIPHAQDAYLLMQNLKQFSHHFYEDATDLMDLKIELAKEGALKASEPAGRGDAEDSPLNVLAGKVDLVKKRRYEGKDLSSEDFEALELVLKAVDEELPFDGSVRRKVGAVSGTVYESVVGEAEDLESGATSSGSHEVGLSADELREKAKQLLDHANKLSAEADKMATDKDYTADQTQLDALSERAKEYKSEADALYAKASKAREMGRFEEADKEEDQAKAKISEVDAINAMRQSKTGGQSKGTVAAKEITGRSSEVSEGVDRW